MRLMKLVTLFIILALISLGFKAPQDISANVPAGFFEVGTDFQIGGRWVRFINNANDMSKISSSVNSNAIFIVTNNIDMSESTFSPASNFTGFIYGFGHTISNLRFGGTPLIATSNSGVIEWLNFENIEIANNTSNFNSLIVGTNSGTLRNISYSLRNTSDILIVVPPMVNSNANGRIENIIGSYNLNIDHQLNNAQSFQFNGIVRTSTNQNISNIWLQGDINITRAGLFSYVPMPDNLTNSRESQCTETVNVNIITFSALEINLNNCYFSSEERVFNLAVNDLDQGYIEDRLFEDEASITNFYRNLASPVFPESNWRLNEDEQLNIFQNDRLRVAGRHSLDLRDHFENLTRVNLYRTPIFNSNLINLQSFSENSNPSELGPFNEALNYSTNYSRIFVNGSTTSQSGTINQFGSIEIRLESDFELPTLTVNMLIEPVTNLSEANTQPIGFIPTTSIGIITDQDGFSWNDRSMNVEGDYKLRIVIGSSSLEYDLRILPIIRGITSDAMYTDEVTPDITASIVLINGEPFENDQSFTMVGHYDVTFPNLPSSNLRFSIEPMINVNHEEVMTQPRTIRISKNNERLFINNLEVNEEFLEIYSEYIKELDDVFEFSPSFGNHKIRIEGVNGYNRTIEFEVQPSFNISTNASNHKTVQAFGGILLVDNQLIAGGQIQLRNVGNYQLKFQIPESQFALNAGEVIFEQQEVVLPVIRTNLLGPYAGSVTPDIQGEGMDTTLNGRPITLEQLNQVQEKPGTYNIVISGKDDFEIELNFEINLVHNITNQVYYDLVSLNLSSPSNTIIFENQETSFDYTKEVIEIGRYQVFTENINGERLLVREFEIAAFSYNAFVNEYQMILDVTRLHPHVNFYVNDEEFLNSQQNLIYDKAGRYVIRFEMNEISEQEGSILYSNDSFIIEPRFDRPIVPMSNIVESYRLLNEVQTFTLNGRTFTGSRFNENNEFFINQNGVNVIIFQGVNGEIFIYEAIFDNPHYQNTLSLIWPAIILGFISAISVSVRLLGVVRHED